MSSMQLSPVSEQPAPRARPSCKPTPRAGRKPRSQNAVEHSVQMVKNQKRGPPETYSPSQVQSQPKRSHQKEKILTFIAAPPSPAPPQTLPPKMFAESSTQTNFASILSVGILLLPPGVPEKQTRDREASSLPLLGEKNT